MSVLWKVVFASACRNTHHKLAIDALRRLRHPSQALWHDLFLKHYEPYLLGAKAPDDQFKDFKNHVLHVRDNYWGGAVSSARTWYDRLVLALRSRQWRDAVFSAGVLSHYISDPIMPLHTAQSEDEGGVHRPAEWSVACCYDELRKLLEQSLGGYPDLPLSTSVDWLSELLRGGAEFANRHYDAVIDHYHIGQGVRNPRAGLDDELKQRLARCLGLATMSVARAFDRAFDDARTAPPAVELTVETVLATLKIPVRYALRMMENEQERAVVRRIYQELQVNGKVIEQLPEDEKTIRRLHAQQVLKRPISELNAVKARPTGSKHGLPGSGTHWGPLRTAAPSQPRRAIEPPGKRWIRVPVSGSSSKSSVGLIDRVVESRPSEGPQREREFSRVETLTQEDVEPELPNCRILSASLAASPDGSPSLGACQR